MPVNQPLISIAASGLRVFSRNINASRFTLDGSAAVASIKFDNDGKVYVSKPFGPPGTNIDYTWLLFGDPSQVEITATKVTGDTPSGTLDSWVSLSSDKTWSLTATNEDTKECTLSFRLRNADTLLELVAPFQGTLQADWGGGI